MIHRLTTLRKVEDLKISSLATHLADLFQTTEELTDENIYLKKRINKLEDLVVALEERLESMERAQDQS